MAKNNHYKAQNKQKANKRRIGPIVTCVLSIAVVVCTAGIMGWAMFGPALSDFISRSLKLTDTAREEPTVWCSIGYPDLQEDGRIFQTGGMRALTGTTLREALEKDYAEDFTVTFAEDGTLLSLGELTADQTHSFAIYESTEQGVKRLDKKGETV